MKRLVLLVILIAMGSAVGAEKGTLLNRKAEDILIADFEGKDYGKWEATGDAFGTGPAHGKIAYQGPVVGFRGKGLVNTFLNGDASTGTLTSPPFELKRKYLRFYIGGGKHKETALQVLLDGKVIYSKSGRDVEPLIEDYLDVSKHKGKTVQLRIIDMVNGGWGHVDVDHIIQSDNKQDPPPREQEKTFTVKDDYLLIPLGSAGKSNKLIVTVDEKETHRVDTILAPYEDMVAAYAHIDIKKYKGKSLHVKGTATKKGFSLLRQGNSIPGEKDYYREPHRPQFHFTQKMGWINDPNGMVYSSDGTWHFFFQHNPYGLGWGNMHWGHAVSKDLLHWKQLPIALYPDDMGTMYSGTGIVDKNNTAGFKTGKKDVVVLVYTAAGDGIRPIVPYTQCIAYSNDDGRTFVKYEGNPIVDNLTGQAERDPKVFWHEPIKKWVMVLYLSNSSNEMCILTSPDLKTWKEESRIGKFHECPELFELPVRDAQGKTKWVIWGVDAEYFIGYFDGKTFKKDHQEKYKLHYGAYRASQTFNNAPKGRRIQMGWVPVGSNGPYNQHFSFPHELTLRTTEDGIRLFAEPVEEIKKLRAKTNEATVQNLTADKPVLLPVGSDLLDVHLSVELGNAKMIELNVPGKTIRYDVSSKMLDNVPLKSVNGKINIRVLVDRSIMEIIGNDGRVFISTDGAGKKLKVDNISVVARGGNAKLLKLEAHEMKSIWE